MRLSRLAACLLLAALVPLSSCDSSEDVPAAPVPQPYTVRYQAKKEGRGLVDGYTLTYTDANGQRATAPEGVLPVFDRTFTVPAGVTASMEFKGVYRVTEDFAGATLTVRIDATRNGVTLSDSNFVIMQGPRAADLAVRTSVVLPR